MYKKKTGILVFRGLIFRFFPEQQQKQSEELLNFYFVTPVFCDYGVLDNCFRLSSNQDMVFFSLIINFTAVNAVCKRIVEDYHIKTVIYPGTRITNG